jgi:hypothetical protein
VTEPDTYATRPSPEADDDEPALGRRQPAEGLAQDDRVAGAAAEPRVAHELEPRHSAALEAEDRAVLAQEGPRGVDGGRALHALREVAVPRDQRRRRAEPVPARARTEPLDRGRLPRRRLQRARADVAIREHAGGESPRRRHDEDRSGNRRGEAQLPHSHRLPPFSPQVTYRT